MTPMHNVVKVLIYIYGQTIEINKFAFEVKVLLGLRRTFPDGRPVIGLLEKLEIEPTYHS